MNHKAYFLSALTIFSSMEAQSSSPAGSALDGGERAESRYSFAHTAPTDESALKAIEDQPVKTPLPRPYSIQELLQLRESPLSQVPVDLEVAKLLYTLDDLEKDVLEDGLSRASLKDLQSRAEMLKVRGANKEEIDKALKKIQGKIAVFDSMGGAGTKAFVRALISREEAQAIQEAAAWKVKGKAAASALAVKARGRGGKGRGKAPVDSSKVQPAPQRDSYASRGFGRGSRSPVTGRADASSVWRKGDSI